MSNRNDLKTATHVWVPAPTALSQSELDATEEAYNLYQYNNRRQRRIAVFNHYGGKCACCGEAEFGFLTIDHIDGKVPEMKDCGQKLAGDHLYKYLIAHNFPPGYQCLCANCNMAIGWWGICPHKGRITESTRKRGNKKLDRSIAIVAPSKLE